MSGQRSERQGYRVTGVFLSRRIAQLFLFLLPNSLLAEDILYEVSVDKFLMGTTVETTARHTDINACREALFLAYKEMERGEALLYYHQSKSEVSEINRNAGVRPVSVGAETFTLLDRAKKHADDLNGLFDVSIGPLSERWGFSSDRESTLPTPGEIEYLLPLVDYRRIKLSFADTSVFLETAGMKIDLGGIAKGYAIDRGIEVLKEQGIEHFFLNAGGDIRVSGMAKDGRSWRVGIRHPRDPAGLIASFDLEDHAVATSGDYERYKMFDGRRYHHVLDPRTGYPGTKCQSVTVLAPTAEEADVLATYLFLLGEPDDSIAWPYIMVLSDGSVTHGGFTEDAKLVLETDLHD